MQSLALLPFVPLTPPASLPRFCPQITAVQVSQTYGYTVVGRGPAVPSTPFWTEVFNWTRPFSKAVWAVLFSSFMFAGIIFVILETDQLGGMFQSDSQHWLFNLWSGFHYGVRAWTQTGYFEPVCG